MEASYTIPQCKAYQTVTKFHRIMHPEFASFESRLKSFRAWELSDVVDPYLLARAGFYFQKMPDQTACYFCGLIIVEWRKQEDPFMEHLIFKPECPFVHINRVRFRTTFCEDLGEHQRSEILVSTTRSFKLVHAH